MNGTERSRAAARGLLAVLGAISFGCGDGNPSSAESAVVSKALANPVASQVVAGNRGTGPSRPGPLDGPAGGLVANPQARKPGPPQAADGRGGSVGTHLVAPVRAVTRPTDCVVDFTDSTALQLTGPSLYANWVLIPWFQQCSGAGHVDFRWTYQNHFHLGFADPDVAFCNTHPQNYPARLDPDGTCHLVDIATEPRTHVLPHVGWEVFRLRAVGVQGNWSGFDLNRVRIPGSRPVKLCYKKQSAIEWEAPGPVDGGSVGWICWSDLGPGLWDLSDYAYELAEVRITESIADPGIFSVDDFHIAIRN